MSGSFITFDDIYLILKPVNIDFDMIFLAVFLLLILVMAYKIYQNKISKAKYIFISLFIVVNSMYIPLFVGRINQEVGRFNHLTKAEVMKEIVTEPEYNLYNYLKNNVKNGEKVFINHITDPYHENVRVKLRLAYYLAPIIITDDIKDAAYVAVVNYKHIPQLDIEFPEGKDFEYKSFSKELSVVKMTDKTPESKEVK
ncbi:MAG: hypothetical protein AB7V50_09875 [Vampirovibrionia bacterium]